MKAAVAKHPVAAFLVLLYTAGWALFLPPLLGRSGFGQFPYDVAAQPFILLVSVFVMAGGAFLVTRIADGPAATRSLARHLTCSCSS